MHTNRKEDLVSWLDSPEKFEEQRCTAGRKDTAERRATAGEGG